MRKILIAAAFAALLLSTSACYVRFDRAAFKNSFVLGEGSIQTETRELDSFTSLRMVGFGDVVFVQSEGDPYVEITDYENLLPYVHTDVLLNELSISVGADSIGSFQNTRLEIIVHAPYLEKVSLAGSGDFSASGLDCPVDFSLSLAGSGDVEIEALSCMDLNVSLAGSGDVVVGGRIAGMATASLAGSGDIVLSGSAASASLAVAGSGDIDASRLEVSGETSKSVRGSGDIRTR